MKVMGKNSDFKCEANCAQCVLNRCNYSCEGCDLGPPADHHFEKEIRYMEGDGCLINTPIERISRFQEKLDAATWYQNQTEIDVHPMTCGKDSNHKLLVANLDNKVFVLLCPDCGYQQFTLPPVVLELYRTHQKVDALFNVAKQQIEPNRIPTRHQLREMFKIVDSKIGVSFDLMSLVIEKVLIRFQKEDKRIPCDICGQVLKVAELNPTSEYFVHHLLSIKQDLCNVCFNLFETHQFAALEKRKPL